MANKLATLPDLPPPDPPAANELERARHLAGVLNRSISLAERFRTDKVSLPIEEAKELCQLLFDSLRTVERINAKGSK